MRAQPATEQWIDAREAAKILGVSERHVNRRAAQGFIQKQTLPRKPNEKAPTVVYSYEDVEALRSGKPMQHEVKPAKPPLQPSAAATEAMLTLAPQTETVKGLAEYLAALTTNVRAINAKYTPEECGRPWLTLQEAAEYSGLPVAYLRKEARRTLQLTLFPEKGQPERPFVVRNVGTLTRECFMFSRESLKG